MENIRPNANDGRCRTDLETTRLCDYAIYAMLSIYLSIHLSICLFIYPSIYLSIYLSIHLLILCLSNYLCFSGSINNLNLKQLMAKASFTAYKDGERVECSDECSDDYKNVENKSLDTSSNEGETIIVPDSLPQKWSKKDIPVDQQQQYKKKQIRKYLYLSI